eukprot:5809835-Pleurochrysis_carterae.AAC.1
MTPSELGSVPVATRSRSWSGVGPAGPTPPRAASADASTATGGSDAAFIELKRTWAPVEIENFTDPATPSSGLSAALPNRVPACKNMGFSDDSGCSWRNSGSGDGSTAQFVPGMSVWYMGMTVCVVRGGM